MDYKGYKTTAGQNWQEGIRALEKAEELFKKHKGHLSDSKAKQIIALITNAINHLTKYPFQMGKAYRINGEVFEEIGDKKSAIDNYSQALKWYPKIGVKGKLKSLDPNNNLSKPIEKRPPLRIKYSKSNSLLYIRSEKSGPPGQAPRGSQSRLIHNQDCCVYLKNHYVDFDSLIGSATITFVSNYGKYLTQIEIDHFPCHFACKSFPGYIATLSYDLKIHLYYPDQLTHIVKDISSIIDKREEIKVFDIPKNECKIYLSTRGTLFIFDDKLELIRKYQFRINNPFGVDENKRNLPIKELSILGLTGNPTNEVIKAAYRKKIFEFHPDLHPENPNANEETRKVIDAFDILTSDDNYSENLIFHDNVFKVFTKYFEIIDSISTILISEINGCIFIGYYSGNILIVDGSGSFQKFFKCEEYVRDIKEIGIYLYFVSNKLEIIRNRELITTISFDGYSKIRWGDNSFGILYERELKMFSLEGTLFGELEFRDNIADFYIHSDNLKVVTASKIHEFKIKPPVEGRQLSASNKILPIS